MTSEPIFPPDPQNQPQTEQYSLLIGCACVLGALLMLAMFVGFALFNMRFNMETQQHRAQGTDITEQVEVGSDFNLYGKTLDGGNFDWDSLRGNYVLVKFTATWCGPCQVQIPGMLEAYEKYHDKGLEIVSIYIWERGTNSVATVRQYVEKEKLPWIILSETLTEEAGETPQGKAFGIIGVPTMLLVDKEGKVLATDTRGPALQRELAKLFDE